MNEITRIQSFLRENARLQYESVAIPPFTLFFHPTDPFPYFNYAIPDHVMDGDVSQPLADLRAEFERWGRTPRFEFFEAFAPDLPAHLRQHDYVEQARQWSMLCRPDSFRPAPVVPDLHITFLSPASPDPDVSEFLLTQRHGFSNPDAGLPSKEDLDEARGNFSRGWTAMLGRVEGKPAGVAGFSSIIDGVCEVGGIATLEPYRRRGIASYLTAVAVQAAFERGATTICLTAEDERAGRVYERIGFEPFSVMLAYIAAQD